MIHSEPMVGFLYSPIEARKYVLGISFSHASN